MSIPRTDGGRETLSLDLILDILAHHHRRAMLRTFRDGTDNTIPEDKIISRLQKQEETRTGQKPSWDHLSATLHHVHLPKLREAGIVAYDESTEIYKYHPDEQLEKWIDLIESEHGTDL